MLSASESIRIWLESQRRPGNQDLIDRILSYGTQLEMQVNVSPTGGEPVHGKSSTFTDGVDQWFSFRLPKGAATQPHWNDFTLRYNLGKHVESIGTTGWNWVKGESLFVGYDFDSIVGHAAGVGISDNDLLDIRNRASQLEYVEVRRSTGGRGLHLWVHLVDGVKTANHTEHAAVARCILSKISEDVGIDLTSHVDTCGGNLWIASKRATEENHGFELIKAATAKFTPPENWRDHVAVVNRSRARVSLPGVSQSEEDIFTELASSHTRTKLDATHLAIRDRLGQLGCAVWVQDHHLLQTHTALLKQVHEEMGLRGCFETESRASNKTSPNCFGFPLADGAWKFVRFGTNTKEHSSWNTTTPWTSCFYNRATDLASSIAAQGAVQASDGTSELQTVEAAFEAVADAVGELGCEVPKKLAGRKAFVKESRNGSVVVSVKRKSTDPEDIEGWSSKKKGVFEKVFMPPSSASRGDDAVVTDYDPIIRCLETPAKKPAGWMAVKADREWTEKSASSIKTLLQHRGLDKPDAEVQMGAAEFRPWCRVCIPFAPEFPGDRKWNLGAPQLKYVPKHYDGENDEYGEPMDSPHPTWDMILAHVGESLDEPLKHESWAIASGVTTGQRYLQCWFASVIKDPFSPLPYLFSYGPENSGKSILHEAFSLLVTRGVVQADKSLTSQSDFNGELEGCIVAVVEEKDLGKIPGARERIKAAVTSPMLSIRRMRADVYEVPNTTHWIQCSNSPDACPIFPGDTRITMLHVGSIKTEIPKSILVDRLQDEAPYFLRTLLDTQMPPPQGRLKLPVVNTTLKAQVADMNSSPMERFIAENTLYGEGEKIAFSEFFSRFMDTKPEDAPWSKNRVARNLAGMARISLVNGTGNTRYIKGITWK